MSQIQVKYIFKASPEIVFDSFLDKNIFKEFMFRTQAGKLNEATLDAEPGGSFVIIEDREGILAGHYGTFVEMDRPEKISFVFSVDKNSDDSDYVEIFINKVNSGTELTLQQEIKPEFSEMKNKIQSGWTSIFEKFNSLLNDTLGTSSATITKDSQGQVLSEGDSVKTIKDLKVKGSSMVIKRGTVVKKIHLITGNDEEVDCKVDGVALALETQWLVKIIQ